MRSSIGGLVAPFVGAWIEMTLFLVIAVDTASLRSSERGLKYVSFALLTLRNGRSVRRSVD